MQPYFFIRTDKQYVKISYSELVCIESLGNYVSIVSGRNTYMTLLSLRQLEKILPPELFCRVSRSCIVSLDHVVLFDKEGVLLKNSKKVAFGDSYKAALEQRVNIVVSDVRNKQVNHSYEHIHVIEGFDKNSKKGNAA